MSEPSKADAVRAWTEWRSCLRLATVSDPTTELADLGTDPAYPELRRWSRREVFDPGVGRGETIDTYWLAGDHGVASAWFADTVELLGHSVCDGLVLHSRQPRDGWNDAGPCSLLDGADCWWELSSSDLSEPALSYVLGRHPVVVAHDAGDLEPMWAWLAAGYEQLRG